jgi:hypothetical protein
MKPRPATVDAPRNDPSRSFSGDRAPPGLALKELAGSAPAEASHTGEVPANMAVMQHVLGRVVTGRASLSVARSCCKIKGDKIW